MIPFIKIFLRADRRWEFHWPVVGTPSFYRVVLWGEQIDFVVPTDDDGVGLDSWDDDGMGLDDWDDDGIGLDSWDDELPEITYVSNTPGYPSFPPPLEIAFENQKVISEIYKPYMYLQWYNEACERYKIEQWQTDILSWSTVKALQQSGSWVNSYQSHKLEDEGTYKFRVFATNNTGVDSQPEEYTEFINCPPDPPNAIVRYNNPNLTISFT